MHAEFGDFAESSVALLRECKESVEHIEPDESTLKAIIDLGVERNVLWGSDYPHFDCTYLGVVGEVTRALGKLSDSARDNILTQNALRFYRLS